jgi:hypothetical protein
MIIGKIQHNGFSYKQIYFCSDKEEFKRINNYDILRIYQSVVKFENTGEFYTLFTDLTSDIEEIRMKFGKTIRQEINRNVKKDNVVIDIIEHPTQKNIIDMIEHYKDFKNFKNLTTDVEYMKKSFLSIRKNIVIFKLIYQNQVLIYHSYIVDNERVKLKTSSSSRNIKDKDIINLISRSNKRMHFEAIKYFKSKKIPIYDGGGGLRNKNRCIKV